VISATTDLPDFGNLARSLPADQLPDLIGQLAAAQALAFSRLLSPAPVPHSDELITVEEGAEMLGMSAEYIYRNSKTLPFVRRVGRSVRCSKAGIQAYIRRAR
jgi:excisionase family DNA binding protein